MNNKFLDELSKIGEEQQAALKEYQGRVDLFWYSLSQEHREMAFHYIVNKIVDLELNKDSSYRGVMAEFNFDFWVGMNANFMRLHNSIYTDEAIEEIKMVAAKEALDKAVPYKVKMFKG